mgnify:CR=1 FL=1
MTSGSRFVPLSFRHFFLADIISLKTMDIYNNKTAANARRFLRDLERACPIRIRTILTDNGKEFTDRLFGLRKRIPTASVSAFAGTVASSIFPPTK